MTSQFKVVGIFSRVKNLETIETLVALIEYLQQLNQPFIIEAETAEALINTTLTEKTTDTLTRVPAYQLNKHCELLIVVGGDGSLLHAAQSPSTTTYPY